MKKYLNLTNISLLIIFTVALFLRVYKLGISSSFTGDEISTINNSMKSFMDIVKLESWTPLQALLIKFEAQVLGMGYSETSIYMLSVVVSLFAVLVIYKLGKLLFSEQAGLLAAFLLALSVYDIYLSRSSRYYALMILLSITAFMCLYRALTTNQKQAWLLYVLFRTLSLYDHLSALWMLFGEGIFSLAYISYYSIRRLKPRQDTDGFPGGQNRWSIIRRSVKAFSRSSFFWSILSFGLILAAYIPVWLPMVSEIFSGNSIFRIGGLSSENLAPRMVRTGQLLTMLGGGWRGPFLILKQLSGWITPLHIILLILFFLGIIFTILNRQWTQLSFILTIIITPFILSIFLKSYSMVLDGRYLVSILPLYYLMGGWGIICLGQVMIRNARLSTDKSMIVHWSVIGVLVVTIAGLNLTRIPLTFRNTGQNWRAVARFLSQNAKINELIIVDGRESNYQALKFYLPGFNIIQNDPRISYDTYYEQENELWIVFEPGWDLYTGLRYWTGNVKALSIVFAAGWYPDIDQYSDLAPAQSWDLYVVHATHTKSTSQQTIEQEAAWVNEAAWNNPGDARGHLSMAEAYLRLDECDKAIEEYNQALDEGYVNDQLASYIYDARSICWSKLGMKESAISGWQKSISRAYWSVEPYQRLFSYYVLFGSLDQAKALYELAEHNNPNKAWPLVMQGDYYRTLALTENAMTAYYQAIEKEPSEQTSYQHLAEVYMDMGKYDQITRLYQEAKNLNPWFGWPYFQLGQFYNSIGRVTDALYEYQRTVAIQPELAPAVNQFLKNTQWDLASNLGSSQVSSEKGDALEWRNNSWARPYQYETDVLVGRSSLKVSGRTHSNQLLFHPYSNQEDTYLEFEIPENYFSQLNIGYGMADKISKLTNGVRFVVEVRKHGERIYHTLIDLSVDKNIWQEETVSLIPYWGDDLEFRLSVNSKGDYSFDWFQLTFDLQPPQETIWDLSDNLGKANFTIDGQAQMPEENPTISSQMSRLVSASDQPVDGHSIWQQVMFHPYSSEASSILTFTIQNYDYKYLKTWFGLADRATPFSNGVDYTVSVSTDNGKTFTDLVNRTVTENKWQSQLVELPKANEFIIKLSSSSLGNIDYDWLQIRLDLIPVVSEETNSPSK